MQSIQTILTIGALGLLTFAVFNMNRGLAESDISLSQNRYRLEALSMITSHIEQATLYFFDEASTDTTVSKTLSSFTDAGSFGFDADDNNEIDDFDDYHGLILNETGRSGVNYQVRFSLDYVYRQGSTVLRSSAKQYNKRMTIYVTDSYNPPLIYKYKNGLKVKDTLQMSFIHSYWFFN